MRGGRGQAAPGCVRGERVGVGGRLGTPRGEAGAFRSPSPAGRGVLLVGKGWGGQGGLRGARRSLTPLRLLRSPSYSPSPVKKKKKKSSKKRKRNRYFFP